MRMVTFAGLSLVLFGALSVARAQPPGGGPNFDALDTDKSGALSKEEVAAFFAQFAGRGGGGGPDPNQIFGRWDSNGDGSVSREEFDARPRFGRGGPPPQ